MLKTNRPKVFISSTVADLADLRSAIKFYLEELGYEVMASEFPDFGVVDEPALAACLKAIERADYYILIVGSNVGTRFGDISITRHEFRHANELKRRGKLRMAVLVRDNIWVIREDRAALESHLREAFAHRHELSPAEISNLSGFPSRVVNDARHVFEFISEIAGDGSSGPENWIFRFGSFRDVVDVLRN